MSRGYYYEKIKVVSDEIERYVLMRDGEPHGEPLEEVAIAFSLPPEEGGMYTMHKHGSVELVEKWLKTAQQRYREAGFSDMSDELMMVVGRFDLEPLNRVLDTTGYLKRFFEYHKIAIDSAEFIKAVKEKSELDGAIKDDQDAAEALKF